MFITQSNQNVESDCSIIGYDTWVKLVSSNIDSIMYKSFTNELFIRFNSGSIYSYENVPVDLFIGLFVARSAGKFFNENIKKYPDMFPYKLLVKA
jgi:hypothetical protein